MNKFALIIGVSSSPESGLSELPQAVEDAKAIANLLVTQGGFKNDNVKLLIDRPTAEDIQINIAKMSSQCVRNDLFLLYFSGHGEKDEQDSLFLISHDTINKNHYNSIIIKAVEARFIRGALNKCAARRQIVILDCCYSGLFNTKTAKGGNNLSELETLLMAEGRAVLASSSSRKKSFVGGENIKHSIYTHFLLEGLQTGGAISKIESNYNANNEVWITVEDAHSYARRKVYEYQRREEPNKQQDPHFFSEGGDGSKIKFIKISSSQIKYATELEKYIFSGRGIISQEDRTILKQEQESLGLSDEIVRTIEEKVESNYQLTIAENKRKKKIKIIAISVSFLLVALTLSITYTYFISNICRDIDENEKIVSVKKGSCKAGKPHGEVELDIKDKTTNIDYAFSGKVNFEDKNNPVNGVLRWKEGKENKLTKYEWTGSIENWLPKTGTQGQILKYEDKCLYKYDGNVKYAKALLKHGTGKEILVEHSQLTNEKAKEFFSATTGNCPLDSKCYEENGKFKDNILLHDPTPTRQCTPPKDEVEKRNGICDC